MVRAQVRSRLSMLIALVFGVMCVGGAAFAQEKGGSEVLKPLVIEKVDEKAAAAEEAMDKAVEKTEEKAEQAAKTIEKQAEKPLVGAGAAAPGSHEGFIPSVQTQYGSITVLGVFQGLLDSVYHAGMRPIDSVTKLEVKDDRFEKIAASVQRARFIVKGHVVSENLTYFFQGDARNEKSFALDMFLGYKFWDTGLSVRVGRFVPEFSYMMPRNTADLDAINYPLYLNSGFPNNFSVWRQVGFDVTYRPKTLPELGIIIGVFNGMLASPYVMEPSKYYMQMGDIAFGNTVTKVVTPEGTADVKVPAYVNNISDNNRAKDVMLRVSYKPMKTLSVDLNAWLGFPANYNTTTGALLRDANKKLVDNDILIMGGPGVEYNDGTLHAMGEFMFRYLNDKEDKASDKVALAAWGHVGYRFTKLIEGIFRLDWVDTDIDAKNTMIMRVTMGPHFWLEEKHFRILVNLYYDIPLEMIDSRAQDIGLQAQFAALW